MVPVEEMVSGSFGSRMGSFMSICQRLCSSGARTSWRYEGSAMAQSSFKSNGSVDTRILPRGHRSVFPGRGQIRSLRYRTGSCFISILDNLSYISDRWYMLTCSQAELFPKVEIRINGRGHDLTNKGSELMEFDEEVYLVFTGIRVDHHALL